MRKTLHKASLLLAILFAFSASLSAQDPIFEETFDNIEDYTEITGGIYQFPEGWTQIDNDGLALNGSISDLFPPPNTAWTLASEAAGNFGFTGGAAISGSWFASGAGPADDYLITPVIDILDENATLTWSAKAQDPDWPDGYEVYISTSNEEEDILALGPADRVFNVGEESPEFVTHTVPLGDYFGESIYVVFRNNSSDKFLLILDYVRVAGPPEGVDVSVSSVEIPMKYGYTPIHQVEPIGPFGVNFSQVSAGDVTNVEVTVNIDRVEGGLDAFYNAGDPAALTFENVYSSTILYQDMLPNGNTDEVLFDETYTPDEIGAYVLYYTIDQEEDVTPENNVSTPHYFIISETDYGRHAAFHSLFFDPSLNEEYGITPVTADEVTPDGMIGDPSGTGEYGMTITPETYISFTEAAVVLLQPFGVIDMNVYDIGDGNIPGELVATTSFDFGPNPQGADFYVFTFDEEVVLAPGEYLITATDPADGTLTMYFTSGYSPEGFGYGQENGSDWFFLSNTFVPIIEIYASEAEAPAVATEVDVTSEPDAEGNGATFNFTAIPNGDVASFTWDFGDDNTGEGEMVTHTFDAPGTYTVCVTALNIDGSEIEACTDVTVEAASSIDFDFEISGLTVDFTASANGFVAGYTWDFGDGNDGDGAMTSNTYEEGGLYEVCVTADLGDGETIEECQEVDLGVASEIGFDIDVNDLTVDVSATADGFVNGYTWDFGGAGDADGDEASFTFEEEGEYDICLTAELPDGGTLEHCETVTIECAIQLELGEVDASSASATASSGQEPYTYNLYTEDGDLVDSNEEGVFEGLESGETYYIEAVDEGGCIETSESFAPEACDLSGVEITIDYLYEESSFAVGFPDAVVEANELVSYNWDASLEAADSDNIVYDPAPGMYTVEVFNDSGCSQVIEFEVPDWITSIGDISTLGALNVYPVPATDFVQLDIQFTETVDFSYEIYDQAGKLIARSNVGPTLTVKDQINVSQLSEGMYFLKLNANNESINQKIIVTH